MMKRRTAGLVLLCVVALLTAGLAPATAAQPQGLALVKITWQGPDGLAALEASGVPVYVRLTAEDGSSYMLAGARSREIEAVQSEGLDVVVLDADMRGATYYLAYAMPRLSQPEWDAYGQLLLDDGVQALLRMTPEAAARLAEAGAELRAVTLDPKPLRPAMVEGAIPTVVDPDPVIQTMIDQIDYDMVYDYTGSISGEWPVTIGKAPSPYTIETRNTYSGEPIQKATQWAGEHLESLGMDVEYHNWSSAQYPNVIAELPGLVDPDEIWIICGHIDDMPSSGRAPGADDNGSGTVGTLIAADLLTQYQWGSTLRFALWTGEEQGLLGSHAYAQRAYNAGENIAGVLNLDMIAWNTGSSNPDIDIHAESSIPPTLELAQLMSDVVGAYSLGLIPQINPNGTGASDHASFWTYGYTAILGIEDFSDFNPYYHTINDDMDNFQDWPYYVDFVKLSVATFAHMNGSLIPSGIGSIDGTVSAAAGGAPIEGATVTIEDGAGHVYTAITDVTGYYAQTLLAGTYDVTASAYSYLPETVSGVDVFEDAVTTVDLSLEAAPAYVVQGRVSEAGSGISLHAEVEFQGSPVSVWTNPATGLYQATLAEGAYTMRVRAAGHQPEERPIVVDQSQTQDFGLEPLPCIALVDDDGNNPDVRAYYTDALDALALDYDVWDVGSEGDPAAEDLLGYKMVLWFTGYPYSNTFNGNNEVAVAEYLDAGGKFFLSSQDYLYEYGITSFGSDYLHIGSFDNDVNQTTVTGQNVFGGLGAYSLSYPFTNYSDAVNPDVEAELAFSGNQGDAAISYEGGTFQTVFFGFPFEAIPNLADRTDVVSALVEWFGGCEPPPVDTVHVQAIKIRYRDFGGGRYIAYATLRILDQHNVPAPGATVHVEWTLPDSSTESQQGVTSSNGVARFRLRARQTGTFEYCVTDVVKAGYTYDPSQNGETCETIVVP